MQKDWYVSMWAGSAPSKKSLLDYVNFTYDDDGDAVPSQFMLDFRMKHVWNEQTGESEFFKKSDSISNRMTGFSYWEKVRESFRQLVGERLDEPCNCLLLLYNYKYSGKVREVTNPFAFRFCGVVPYEHEDDLDMDELERLGELIELEELAEREKAEKAEKAEKSRKPKKYRD